QFVAHPNIQQLLAALWYEGVPGFRRKTAKDKIMIIVRVAVLFPFYCMLYMLAPETKSGKLMRKPFMKFLIHASSYLFFVLLLILVSLRADDLLLEHFGSESMKAYVKDKYDKQRGNPPTILEYAVLLYVVGFIFEETQEIFVEGMRSYLRNLWNFIDFTRNVLYSGVVVLRVASYLQQQAQINNDPTTAYIHREEWDAFDPQLIAEGLFAAANIFSALKLVHLFSINPHLGPLQISLGRMVIDIVKFFFIYTLVLFAFACGLNQLLWYFSDLEKKKCYHLPSGDPDFDGAPDACMKWRRFANVFESSQSLFWASFGMVDLDSFELAGIKTYTRFWGLLMFGSYSVINVIVLLNLLIAMMSNSYAMIDEHSDTEWKFARTKLWMSYFEETGTLPPPFNIFPKPKNLFKLFGLRKKDKLRRMSTKRRNREEKERDYRYTAVMRALVWRYVAAMHRKVEESAVTEDDINEVKSDISSFRYEVIEVLSKNGMDVSSAQKKEKAVLGKRMKVWERRLMKDFKVAPVATDEDEDLFAPPPDNEEALAKFRRIAKLAVLDSGINKWRQVVRGAQIASQIGHCHRRESLKKRQNLLRAMEEAQRLAAKSPDNLSRAITPIILPDTSRLEILDVLKLGDGSPSPGSQKRVALSPHVTVMHATHSPPSTAAIEPPASSMKQELQKEEMPKEGQSAETSREPSEEPDLINLDSAKNSPVTSKKILESSQDSIDQLSESSDDKVIQSPPIIVSPPLEGDRYSPQDSIDHLSESSEDKMIQSPPIIISPPLEGDGNTPQDSIDHLSESSEDKMIQSPLITASPAFPEGSIDQLSESSDEKMIQPLPIIVSPPPEDRADSHSLDSVGCLEAKIEPELLERPSSPLPRIFDTESGSTSPEMPAADLVMSLDDGTDRAVEVCPETGTNEPKEISGSAAADKEVLDIVEKSGEDRIFEAEQQETSDVSHVSPAKAVTPKLPEETEKIELGKMPTPAGSRATTPMTQRNIQRIEDTKRVQPKYGWL
ncbi:unnamed protein product, partial [Callosobruchus maculatus]